MVTLKDYENNTLIDLNGLFKHTSSTVNMTDVFIDYGKISFNTTVPDGYKLFDVQITTNGFVATYYVEKLGNRIGSTGTMYFNAFQDTIPNTEKNVNVMKKGTVTIGYTFIKSEFM